MTDLPIYLTGVSSDYTREAAESQLYGRLGVLLQPGTWTSYSPQIPSYSAWAADNGCFAKGGEFDEQAFLDSLDRTIQEVDGAWDSCLFAVAPDVFDPIAMRGDAIETILRSLPVLNRIRETGAPAAMVFQDGLQDFDLDAIPWDCFDVAFLGGSDEFKLGYPNHVTKGNPHYATPISPLTRRWARLIERCHTEGKPVHVGRCNSFIRMAFALEIGADSADGTFVKFGGPHNLNRISGWFDKLAG